WRDFTKESGCQAGGSGSQEVVAEIARKLEKQEKKLLKKEKKHLAAISLISSENSSSFSKGCEETSGRPMEKKRQKPQEAPQENGGEDLSSPSPNRRKRNLFPKEELSQGTGVSPRNGGNSLPRRSHSAVDPKRQLPARAVAPRKRKLRKPAQENQNGHFPSGT
ncbi:hypothetical protein Celaphus_00012060, partial [Cervus elaphus hippelaphus]